MDGRLHVAMQQLLRYGAFAQLLTSLQTTATVEAAAGALARQWKFCANVSDWRYVAVAEREALRIDAGKGTAKVQHLSADDLLPWERDHAAPASPRRPPAGTDAAAEPRLPGHLKLMNLGERLIVPASAGGRLLGAFFIGSDTAALDALDRKFVELVASLFAARIADLMSHDAETKKLRRQATIDALTQLANRRQFDTRLAAEWARAERERHAVALVLLDIDFFKQYNDEYGHPQGDACLREVARLVQAAVRPTDLVARVGGEEFAILLPALAATEAALVAQRVLAAITIANIPHARSGVAGFVTVSLGVASQSPGPASSPDSLYAHADQGLYAAKRAGRNRVQIHERVPGAPQAPDA